MKVGIIGAGTMGSGIAQVFAAEEGYQVVLCDISQELADKGKGRIASALARRVERGKMEQSEADTLLGRIETGLKDICGDCDLIVEAALENMDIKKQTFRELSEICGPECLFATNTSSLSVTEISKGLDRPVTGMHFFNPAPAMKLVEIVVGDGASEEIAERITKIAEEVGKTPVRVKDSPGFAVNRILIPMINEAAGMLDAGIASAEGIDTAMKLGASHPMGPLELGDLVGLDICLAIMQVIHRETGDDKYKPAPLLEKMVAEGRLGRKTGEGFYKY